MSRSASRVYLVLLYLLPAALRRRDGEELLAAFLACRQRERARFGVFGGAYVWLRATTDLCRPPSLCAEMPGVHGGLPPFVRSQPREETA